MGIEMANHPIHDIKTLADYISAAKALPQDHLSSAFVPSDDFKDFTRKQETMAQIKATSVELGTHSGSTEGVITNGVGLKRQNEQAEQAKGGKGGKRGNNTINLMTLLSQLDNHIGDLQNSIADREHDLEERLGDAWIEIIAGKVLDPDEMPARQEGESIPDWRARVEDKMNEKMIDPETGEIRDEYKNHPDPDVREAAKLAQEKYDLEKLEELKRGLNDPSLTDDEKRELIEEYNQSSTGSRILLERVLTPEQMEEFGQNTDEFEPELQSGGTLDALSIT